MILMCVRVMYTRVKGRRFDSQKQHVQRFYSSCISRLFENTTCSNLEIALPIWVNVIYPTFCIAREQYLQAAGWF